MAQATTSKRRTIAAGIAGNVLEWYDFAVYGFFAPLIGQQFFPSDDPSVSLIASFGAFAAGFLMRPVGAAFFGHIGDRLGRGRALVLSVLLMAVPTFLIGLLPNYGQIGVAASVGMVVLRMAQGMAVGGEYTSSIVYLAEQAPAGRRAFFSSLAMFGATGGILLGSAVAAGLSSFLPEAALQSWGWRAAFVFGLAVAGVGFVIRRGMGHDAPPAAASKSPLKEAFREHGRSLIRVCALNVVGAVTFYLMFVYVVTWLVDEVGEPKAMALDINTIAMASLLVFVPLAALVSDRFGRRRTMILGMGGICVLAYPLLWMMHHADPVLILTGQIAFAALIAACMASIPAAMTEMFPHGVRVTAVSVGYNLTFAIFGGTAPLVAVWLIERTHDDLALAWYISAMALVSLIAVWNMPDRRNEPLP